MNTPIVAPINAEHETAVAFNNELKLMHQKRCFVVLKLQDEGKKVASTLRVEYSYKIVDASKDAFVPPEVRAEDAIRVIRMWKNKGVYDAVAKCYGYAASSEAPTTVSCYYYRVNSILVKAGQGKDILLSNIRVSDEEWVNIKRGAIHDKLAA